MCIDDTLELLTEKALTCLKAKLTDAIQSSRVDRKENRADPWNVKEMLLCITDDSSGYCQWTPWHDSLQI